MKAPALMQSSASLRTLQARTQYSSRGHAQRMPVRAVLTAPSPSRNKEAQDGRTSQNIVPFPHHLAPKPTAKTMEQVLERAPTLAPADHLPSEDTSSAGNPDSPAAADRSAQTASTSGNRVVLESEDELTSTWEHRAWVGGASALFAAIFAAGARDVHDLGSLSAGVAAVLSAYVLAGALQLYSSQLFVTCGVQHLRRVG